jgi:hypothetical protein
MCTPWRDSVYAATPLKNNKEKDNNLQLKTGVNLIYTVRNWAGDKLPSVSLNSSTKTGC